MAIAIDFGTSNTVVSRWNPATQQAETIKLPNLSTISSQNPPLIPSLLYLKDAIQPAMLIGQQVRDQGLDISNNPRFFRNFKRGIGSNIQGFLPAIDGQTISFEKIGELFLTNIVENIKTIPLPIDSLIFTVPVDSFETYRHWLGEVSQSLQVEQVRMIDEPTAVALGYGQSGAELLLVIDFGGGTLDLSLVKLDQTAKQKPLGFILKWGEKNLAESSAQKAKIARVLAKAGQNLGGADIDHWLMDYFAHSQNLPKNALTLRLAEKLKIQLSLQPQASEVFFDDQTLDSGELLLNREQLENILREQQFLANLDEAIQQIFQQARRQGIEAKDIDAVLLVGGTAQIPAVQNWVKQYFDNSQIKSHKVFEAIAHGALQLSLGIEIKDFLYHSYGVRYWDRRKNTHNWHPIIKSGQPYPMEQPVELLLGASLSNQPSIELILGELGNETGATEVYFDGDRLITRKLTNNQAVQPLNDTNQGRNIASLNPPGNPGSDRIKVQFQVDDQRFLRITVDDLLTKDRLLNNQAVVQLS
jgi:molecular chaperone DnaK (HSP70)